MTIKECYDLWLTKPLSKQIITHFKKCNVYEEVMKVTSFMDTQLKEYSFTHRVYLAVNNYQNFPKCILCGNNNNTKTGIDLNGYNGEKQYCNNCSNKRKADITRQHLLEREGITNVSQRQSVKDAKIKTCLKNSNGKYSNPSQNPDIIKLKYENCLKHTEGKFGWYTQIPEIKQKINNTIDEKYHQSISSLQ